MKTSNCKLWVALALALAGCWPAMAQRNRMSAPTVPGPNDYTQFAQFITVRNIFNPQRYRITPGYQAPPPNRPNYAPTFTLVGTMNYEKGMFAFFDGNQTELRKVLYTSDTNGIAGYVLTNISSSSVILLAPDKQETVQMKIGDSMQKDGSTWRLAMAGRNAFSSGGNSRSSSFGGGNNFNRRDSFGGGDNTAPAADSSSPEPAPAPSPALEGNDVLKRLMQQREQQIK
jgi:hypothetical protein